MIDILFLGLLKPLQSFSPVVSRAELMDSQAKLRKYGDDVIEDVSLYSLVGIPLGIIGENINFDG